MRQKTDELFIKACAANSRHTEQGCASFQMYILFSAGWWKLGSIWTNANGAAKKIRLAAVLNYIFSLFVMLDFKRLSAVDSTRVPQLSGLLSTALMGWLSSVTELNCYQLFIIHPITSISAPVCDLPTTGGLFIRFCSMETHWMLIECKGVPSVSIADWFSTFHFTLCDKWYKLLCSDTVPGCYYLQSENLWWPRFGVNVVLVHSFFLINTSRTRSPLNSWESL